MTKAIKEQSQKVGKKGGILKQKQHKLPRKLDDLTEHS